MKFSNYEPTENGFNVKSHSKFLDLIFRHYGRKARKLLIKKGVITKKDKVLMSVDYNLKFDVQREGENGNN